MFSGSKKDKQIYAIIGLGRFGYALAMELASSDAELLVLDKNEEKIREIREITDNALVVNGYDKKTLAETGVQNCDVAVVCIGEQMDISILMTLNLVSLGIPKVIAKATSLEHGEILAKLGAEVVYPERDMAIRLAHRLETAKMLDYIQAHFTEPITLEDISAAACVSRRECLRCFQRITRTSPKQYVTALRLQRAKNLLAGTTLSLSEIGEACGFQDQSYFTKLFRRDTGLPPGQWRRKYSNI